MKLASKVATYTLAMLLAFLAALFTIFPMPVWGDEVDTYSTTPGNNNSASPDGFPENMAPSGVNDSAREVMAAIKRWYDDTQGMIVSTGSSNTYAMAASRTVSSYATGQVYSFIANHSNTGAVDVNVDSVGAKDLLKPSGDELGAGDIRAGQRVLFAYNATADNFQILSTFGDGGLSSPVAVADGGTGSTSAADARTALGLLIESDVQAHDGGLSDIASVATTAGNVLVGDGSNWTALTVGSDDTVVVATSGVSAGVAWSTIPFFESYDSGNQTITAGGSLTLDHAMSATPTMMQAYYVNLSADCNYSPGQIVYADGVNDNPSARNHSLSATNSTQIFVRFGNNGLSFLDNDSGGNCIPTASNFAIVIRAYR